MNRKKIKITILFACLLIVFSNMKVFSLEKDKVIKVGFYSYAPYYYKDENNKVTGFYDDLLAILSKDAHVKYEYVPVSVDNAIAKLKNKEVDIVLGVHKIEERMKGIYYSENYISVDNQSIYTKDMTVDHGNLNYLKSKKVACVKGDINVSWLSMLLEKKSIKLDLIETENIEDSIELFKKGEVDAISLPTFNNSLKKYNEIYKYSSGLVYLAGNENSKDIINKFDQIINKQYHLPYFNKLLNVYNKYFRKEIIVIDSIFFLLILLFVIFINNKVVYPFIKKLKKRGNIRKNKEENKFTLYYQPIVNPRTNIVAGFEGLLRLKDKNNRVLPPSDFLKDIEQFDMLCEMTLWILERAIHDYKVMSNYDYYKDKDFYISINLSPKELENEKFINKVISMIKESNIKKGSIRLEIVENISTKDLKGIKSTIEILKENGFEIAIDDFGIEYSNLNMLEMVAFDTVKLDKYFTDKMLKSETSNEVVKFLSNITLITNKNFIIEGVEEEYQVEEIKKLSNNNTYIQGYFYSMPLPIEDVEEFLSKISDNV